MSNFIITGILKKMYPDAMLQEGLITKSEYNKITAYIKFTDAFVYFDASKGFIIDIPQDTIIFNNKADFIQDIDFNLECIKEAYHDRECDY